MSDAAHEAWPDEPLWDYSVALYGVPAVEAACLELQERHGIDVNMVLLCLWLGKRGIGLDGAILARLGEGGAEWRVGVVEPLRALRRRLGEQAPSGVADASPDITASLRARALALEIDAEHLEQLYLGRTTAGLPATAVPGPALAAANLRRYGRFDRRDQPALRALLVHGFEAAPGTEIDSALRWLEADA